jgi:hypothetical protein
MNSELRSATVLYRGGDAKNIFSESSDGTLANRVGNLRARVGETLQDFMIVFAQQRRWEPVQHRSGGKPHRVGDTAGYVECWMLDLDDQPARQRLRIVECFADSLDS